MAKNYRLNVDQQRREVTIEDAGEGRYLTAMDGVEREVVLESLDDSTLFRLQIDGERTPVAIRREGSTLDLFIGPDRYSVEIERAAAGGLTATAPLLEGDVRMSAPMTGQVSELLVAEGDEIEAEDPLLVIVAMKMNNEIRAPVAGRISEVRVEAGAAVEQGDPLLVIEAAGADAGGGDRV